MGKTSKRMKRRTENRLLAKQGKDCVVKEQRLDVYFAEEEYAKVLELLAELVKAGDVKANLLYKGAYSYFMLGDTERAAQWVINTLNFAPEHTEARLLLARICFLENREEDGFAVCENLLARNSACITDEQCAELKDILAFYVHWHKEKIQKFHHLSTFLGVHEDEINYEEEITNSYGQQTGNKIVGRDLGYKDETESEFNPKQKIAEVEAKQCSLRDKIKLLNQFAAGEYLLHEYESAEIFLRAALNLDEGDAATLRNMTMVQVKLGNRDKAQTFFTYLPETDFVLLQMLEDMGNG